ncbi:hypothetical protein EIP86_003851 [Pleurotus ostreatoroseus]|nr:hypothetical protein EIP86_003851 [Pleurotus ostreatoroseus]
MPGSSNAETTKPNGILWTLAALLLVPFAFAARTFDFDIDIDDLYVEPVISSAGLARHIARIIAYLRLALKFQIALLYCIVLCILTAKTVVPILSNLVARARFNEYKREKLERGLWGKEVETITVNGELYIPEGCRVLHFN